MRMGKSLAMAALVATDAIAYQNTKQQLVIKEDPQQMKHTPAVQATTNSYCAVDREDLEVCFDFAVGLKIGWEFNQDFYDDTATPDVLDGYYVFELSIFSEQEANIEFHLFVERLIDILLGGDLSSFKLKLNLGFSYFYDTYETCVFGDLSIADFSLNTFLEIMLVQFYKDVIESLWTIDNWSSRWALFFDDIELSNAERITIYSQQFDVLSDDIILYGTRNSGTTVNGTIYDCWPRYWGTFVGPLGAASEYNYAADAMSRVTQWFGKMGPSHAGQTYDSFTM